MAAIVKGLGPIDPDLAAQTRGPAKKVIAVSEPVKAWIDGRADEMARQLGRSVTQSEVIERLIAHWEGE